MSVIANGAASIIATAMQAGHPKHARTTCKEAKWRRLSLLHTKGLTGRAREQESKGIASRTSELILKVCSIGYPREILPAAALIRLARIATDGVHLDLEHRAPRSEVGVQT
jgi:hypothetical protein